MSPCVVYSAHSDCEPCRLGTTHQQFLHVVYYAHSDCEPRRLRTTHQQCLHVWCIVLTVIVNLADLEQLTSNVSMCGV